MAQDAGSELVADNLAHAAELHGNTTAALAHEGAAAEHHVDPTALGMNATAWVALAMIVVIVLMVWKKVPALIGGALDKKIASIRVQLDEASRLRAEAEALKAEYERKAAAAASEADAMIAHARDEAEGIVAKAKADASALIERRGKMAEDKIAAAERTAIAEVRAKAAAAASAAAAELIAKGHDAAADKALVDQTIAGIGSARLN
ncbi:F-type H+-transporting ATPase subunit b [Sphingomonas laterariae]|uniref:ATP synthase subunit b n=1 Tax=Edaphosphingomonas laterariae TaxID=861865 RepID=A0A239G7C0_9SPHN|nr:F0F1 ATP synthase subunit B [Sphingomonas laterariae]SNS64981.1 F-type H+-transporting ATPase subunit b [Sphingomonas laterariae]